MLKNLARKFKLPFSGKKMALLTHIHSRFISKSADEFHGRIEVIFGPMFSGKSTELLRLVKRYQIADYRCLLIKYAHDLRYDKENVATHDLQMLPAISLTSLSSVKLDDFEVIGIDEGQFFPDIVEFSENMASKGKIIIVAALDATYQRQPFNNIVNLIPLCESVVKLNAVCHNCNGVASFTRRKTSETAVEVIGGADKYIAVCRACFYKELGPTPIKKNSRLSTNGKLLNEATEEDVKRALKFSQ